MSHKTLRPGTQVMKTRGEPETAKRTGTEKNPPPAMLFGVLAWFSGFLNPEWCTPWLIYSVSQQIYVVDGFNMSYFQMMFILLAGIFWDDPQLQDWVTIFATLEPGCA